MDEVIRKRKTQISKVIQIPSLNNLSINEIEFNSKSENVAKKLRNLKPVLPTKIYHHGYYKTHNKNKKILPELPIKTMSEGKIQTEERESTFNGKKYGKLLKNTRNSDILNSIIDILKSDPDSTESSKTRNGRIKTEPSYMNQFIQSREISSVKNSRGPRIIANDIMMLGNQKFNKRNLVSEEKRRTKVYGEDPHSLNKRIGKKIDPFDEMEMTFYKPSRNIINQFNLSEQKLEEENQFIME